MGCIRGKTRPLEEAGNRLKISIIKQIFDNFRQCWHDIHLTEQQNGIGCFLHKTKNSNQGVDLANGVMLLFDRFSHLNYHTESELSFLGECYML